ncbi:2-hydroxyacid dehydrogenase [Effusibacillus lacus]|uniref:D-glycerate dehydrogenase n=1 Tax=Effusibacillus lacus TaxID=1348429 RepID=A0A292YKX8_9BACL|nr:D-glycerate dehydrogenase [Effusibacillus lacus]TCS67850.1 glyoxylate reductase [Effusibacillus lacus]GAX89826.1 D-glycerate dehydrogenase [Effusibacillus lacus]
MKPKVYITRKLPEEVVSRIREVCEIRMWEEEEVPVPRFVLENEIAKIDGLYCLLTETIDRTLLEKAPKLKVVSNMAVGYNNIEVSAATDRGILVTNTPGVLTETTADLTFALLMATARRIVESSGFLRSGQWKTWSPMLLTGQDIHGATLGIIGLGRIGEALARRAKGFDMRLLYHNRSRKPDAENRLGLEYTDMETLLRESDFVCVMTPYTPETHNLIGKAQLALMKKNAVLINTARGGIVNEDDLYEALKKGTIWAAGLDVFEQEPIPLNHPLLTLPNVVTLPHIGSASVKTRLKMAHLAADNLLQALSGQRPAHPVNPEVLKQNRSLALRQN